MLSFNFSTLLVFLLPYLTSTTTATPLKKAWEDPVPCESFYDKGRQKSGDIEWRGGTDCWCPDKEKYGNNYYWYHSGEVKPTDFRINAKERDGYYQGENIAQNWFNCDPTALDVENPNVEWAARHCDSIPKESGVKGWGESYRIPNMNTSLNAGYAMRCEYPDLVAPNCLCPEKTGGAEMCSKKMEVCALWPSGDCLYYDYVWGRYNYSDPEYCTKLNMTIDRPFGSMCMENAHCAVGLQCSDGVCSTCPTDGCPDRAPSQGLSHWKNACKYGEYECPHFCGRSEGVRCNPTNQGLGFCLGLKWNSVDGRCIEDDCIVDGECTEDDDNTCQGYFCLENTVVNGEGRECYIEDNGVSSNCSISGTFCDVESNTCYRSYDEPTPIYKPHNSTCTEHFECDKGLYCNGGMCSVCQVTEECPEKRNPNFPVCKYGEYGCPDPCVVQSAECNYASASCCRGSKCDGKTCVSCKMSGDCSSDDGCCDKYGYHENGDGSGTVIYAAGQKCGLNSDCLLDLTCDLFRQICN